MIGGRGSVVPLDDFSLDPRLRSFAFAASVGQHSRRPSACMAAFPRCQVPFATLAKEADVLERAATKQVLVNQQKRLPNPNNGAPPRRLLVVPNMP